MFRSLFLFGISLLAAQAHAQSPVTSSAQCQLRVTASPASWMINGIDPFSEQIAEGTFSAMIVNEGNADCRFTPVFEMRQPPFGLSKGTGKPIRYALINLTESLDVTPRAGRSQRNPSGREMVLKPRESRSILYKLAADLDDIRDSGTFTQDLTLEALDGQFRSLGGAPVVVGMTVLPSARIGLTGAYSMNDGQAVVDLGELRPGVAPVPLQLRVSSTGEYDISVSSANSGKLRLGASDWSIPYSVAIGGNSINLNGASMLAGPGGSGFKRDSLPIQFLIGDVSDKRAGTYSDVISISVTAR
ncbi:hypothetical protein [Sphingorhabdus pulchriflava]|nr:hypothetical protein [Sphingorhabdus pulchriflava]